ncbi:MAG TPA: recombinase family protein, partial [Phototrophicaceae bacterium]|nr:recombinase family protein [Phototrophicaceae bacterium]
MSTSDPATASPLRYAGYIRVSKEEPSGGFSLDVQERTIRQWIGAHEGRLVQIYADGGQSGRTSERDAFQHMRRDAAHHQFNALVVMKFDRLNRNRRDSLAFKSLLRYDYGIPVFSVTEPSEETHGENGMYIEGLMESVAEWYIHNLSVDMAQAKRERSTQGYQNNQAPFGMTKDAHKVLIADENELPGLLMAFNAYATGEYRDGDIAQLLNDAGYTLKSGNRFSQDTVREILKNQVYIGKVKYQEQRRKADGSADARRYEGLEWFEGKHQPVVDLALFEKCREIRAVRGSHHRHVSQPLPNILKGLIYCDRCYHSPPENVDHFQNWGRMRITQSQNRHFRCTARDYSVDCPQPSVHALTLERKIIE